MTIPAYLMIAVTSLLGAFRYANYKRFRYYHLEAIPIVCDVHMLTLVGLINYGCRRVVCPSIFWLRQPT